MKKVLYAFGEPKEEKGVEFTHYLDGISGWNETSSGPSRFNLVSFLGKCKTDGDMFACANNGVITIYKGHLNNGTY